MMACALPGTQQKGAVAEAIDRQLRERVRACERRRASSTRARLRPPRHPRDAGRGLHGWPLCPAPKWAGERQRRRPIRRERPRADAKKEHRRTSSTRVRRACARLNPSPALPHHTGRVATRSLRTCPFRPPRAAVAMEGRVRSALLAARAPARRSSMSCWALAQPQRPPLARRGFLWGPIGPDWGEGGLGEELNCQSVLG